MRILDKISSAARKWQCMIGQHEWTSEATEGHSIDAEQLEKGLEGLLDYITMYCKHCKVESEISKQEKDRIRREGTLIALDKLRKRQ
jgi:hypothetical protein